MGLGVVFFPVVGSEHRIAQHGDWSAQQWVQPSRDPVSTLAPCTAGTCTLYPGAMHSKGSLLRRQQAAIPPPRVLLTLLFYCVRACSLAGWRGKDLLLLPPVCHRLPVPNQVQRASGRRRPAITGLCTGGSEAQQSASLWQGREDTGWGGRCQPSSAGCK